MRFKTQWGVSFRPFNRKRHVKSSKGQTRQFSHDQKLAFVDAANPHQWLLTAENLHAQAQVLRRHRGNGAISLVRGGHRHITWDNTNRSTFLLAAFAMENMLKSFLVYENPSYIDEGYLKKIMTHDLCDLAERSSLVPHKVRDRWVFERLSNGNESWARYPCGLNADDVAMEDQFTDRLWFRYCAMMAAYQKKMERLLSRGWTCPYGRKGRWIFKPF